MTILRSTASLTGHADAAETIAHAVGVALADYEAATIATANRIQQLPTGTPMSPGHTAATPFGPRCDFAAIARYTPNWRPAVCRTTSGALFVNEQAETARLLLRSSVRRTHDLGFGTHDEITLGELAVSAIREVGGGLSHLAYRLAYADHVEYIHAASTLGRPVHARRDFVVRSAVLGLGDALNAEHEPELPASVPVEVCLAQARSDQQRR